MCRIINAHAIRHRLSSASLFKRLAIEPCNTYHNCQRWTGHVARMPLIRAPRKILTCLVDNPRPLGWQQMNRGRTLKKELPSNDLSTEFFKRREIAADRNLWCAVCGSKMPSASKETPTSSRQDIWAELPYGNVPSWVQKFTRKLHMSKQNEQKNTYSQTSRLENPKELQLQHNRVAVFRVLVFWSKIEVQVRNCGTSIKVVT
jgi:hypothetical protein